MNIALVAPYELRGTGGIATVLRCLQRSVSAKGHRVVSVLDGDTDTVQPVRRADWPDTYAIHFRRAFGRDARLKRFAAFWLYLPLGLASLARFLRREEIDVVHIHFPTPVFWRLAILSLGARWRMIATFHGSDVYRLADRTWFYRVLLRLLLTRADRVTAVSSDLLRALTARYPAVARKARVIPNGMPLSRGNQPDAAGALPGGMPERFILAVGSLIPRKGYDVLIEALGLAQSEGCELNLVIAGGGPEGPKLMALARQLNVHERVFLAGEVAHRDISLLYSRARFFVHPAREEGFGLVVLEAMACGKAVIASRVGGIVDLVRDGDTGVLVAPDDAPSLAAAITRLDGEEALRISLAARGQAFVSREHSWEQHTQRYLDAYASLVSAPEARGVALRSTGSTDSHA